MSSKKPDAGPPLPPEAREKFHSLLSAALNHELCLVACKRRKDPGVVYVLCAVTTTDDGTLEFFPLAKQFDGNPYDEVIPLIGGDGQQIYLH